MVERQAAHRQALESSALDGKLPAERRGQALGFTAALTAIVAGSTLVAFDKDVGGLATIAGALAGLVAVFVYGRRKDADERRQKRADFASARLRLPYEDDSPSGPEARGGPPDGERDDENRGSASSLRQDP